jgi:ribosomal protein S18 acetylase RimI-like enzyme
MQIRTATEEDLLALAGWFRSEHEARQWGGPAMHFPLDLAQLRADIQWDTARSYALVDEDGRLAGFAQILNRFGRRHLARIAVAPALRGRGIGRRLMTAVLEATGDGPDFSLFVYEDNIAARKLYEHMGFEAHPCPPEQPQIQDCLFMVRQA